MNLLLAYAFRSKPPADMAGFRRVTQPGGPLGAISAICFLLYPPQPGEEPELSVDHFLQHTMPRLLPQLSRTTQRQRVELQGHAHGRIDWPSTYKLRNAQEGNPTLFACQQSRRLYDQPENQLLKFLLSQIQACLESTPSELQTWLVRRATTSPSAHNSIQIGRALATYAYRIRRYQANVYLRDVTLPASIVERHLVAARTAMNPLYTQVADLYELHQAVVHVQEWQRWVRALNQTAPRPPQMDETTRLLLSTTRSAFPGD